MKMLLLLIMMILIVSCEESGEPATNNGESTANNDETETIISDEVIEDYAVDYYGVYETACIADGDLNFGQGYRVEIDFNSTQSTMKITEYGEHTCMTETMIKHYDLDYQVRYVDGDGYFADVDYTNSYIEVKHTSYIGYNDCTGVIASSLDVEYNVNAGGCDASITGGDDTFSIVDNNDGTFVFNQQSGDFDLTLVKQ